MKIPIGTRLTPKVVDGGNLFTGFAIVVSEQPLPDYMLKRKGMYDYDCLYTVLTDFGNTCTLSPDMILSNYILGDVEDVKARIEKIIENHKQFLQQL